MIIHGSLRHSPSGRKRNTNAWKKAKKPDFEAQSRKTMSSKSIKTSSCKPTEYSPVPDNSWKVEESKKFTVAPAYNKGAYQVIPQGDVKWIGK